MGNSLTLLVFLLFSFQTHAFDPAGYAQSGEELCRFIHHELGGLNEHSLRCASNSGAGLYSAHESSFCHKVISERRVSVKNCLDVISSAYLSDEKLDKCELFFSEKEILFCLKTP